MRWRTLCVAAVLGALVIGGCGGDDGGAAPEGTGAADASAPVGGGGAPDPSSAPTPGSSGGDADCEQVSQDAQTISVTAVILPQLDSASSITDEFILGDLGELRSAAERLEPLVTGDGSAALADILRAIDIVERGRSGDAEAAAAELQELTGGVDGFVGWSQKIGAVIQDVTATTGCPIG